MPRNEPPPIDPGVENLRREISSWRWMVSALAWFWALAGSVAVVAGIFALTVFIRATYEGKPGPKVTVEIPSGTSGAQVGELLTQQGLIEHEGLFRLALRLYPPSGAGIRHGMYELPKGYSARQLLEQLMKGPDRNLLADQVRLTIPEGLSIQQIAELFDNPPLFIASASDPELLAKIGIEAETLEGFLMPNTYFFDEKPGEKEAVTRMVEQFLRDYNQLLATIPGAADYDMKTIVTVASLIEEEARTDEERALVASVIYNRLKQNMPLQMDSTLQFILGKYGQRMLDVDKQADSPYNTYKYRGLPPGPIANPGAASIRAAMQPAQSDYLYFVSNADGKSHTFSRTLDEHNSAVARYNREIRIQREAQQNAGDETER